MTRMPLVCTILICLTGDGRQGLQRLHYRRPHAGGGDCFVAYLQEKLTQTGTARSGRYGIKSN